MPQPITEQPRSSDGRFAPSNPAPASPAPEAAPTGGASAQALPDTNADYQKLWTEAKERTTDAPASPDPTSGEAPAPAASQTTTAAVDSPPAAAVSETPATPAEPSGFALADYGDTMSANERALLKSVKFLPPATQWKGMNEEDRLNLLDGARSLRNHSNRQFNQRNNPQAGQPVRSTQPQQPSPAAGSPGQTAPAGQAMPSNLPPDVAGHLQKVAAEYGEESSIFQSQLAMATRYEEQLQRLSSTATEFEQQRTQAALDQQDRRLEDAAAKQLEAKYPQLADPIKRDLAREQGRIWLKMLAEQGRIDPSDQALPAKVMEFGAAFHFSHENQQSSQQQRQQARQRSLDSTFDRANPTPAAKVPPANPDEAMGQMWKALGSAHGDGKEGKDAVRQALKAVG